MRQRATRGDGEKNTMNIPTENKAERFAKTRDKETVARPCTCSGEWRSADRFLGRRSGISRQAARFARQTLHCRSCLVTRIATPSNGALVCAWQFLRRGWSLNLLPQHTLQGQSSVGVAATHMAPNWGPCAIEVVPSPPLRRAAAVAVPSDSLALADPVKRFAYSSNVCASPGSNASFFLWVNPRGSRPRATKLGFPASFHRAFSRLSKLPRSPAAPDPRSLQPACAA